MIKKLLNFTALLLTGSLALAHGENIPGPHGGHIRMPSNFHTEVVAGVDNSFDIYLLDLQFQNPIVKKSSVQVSALNEFKKKIVLKCKVVGEDHFKCISANSLKIGSLIVKATRDGTKATMEAKYELPLKPFTSETNASPADHSKH